MKPILNPNSSLRPILVVEDNDMDLDFCMQAFTEHAIANPVFACRDGEEAIQFIDAHPNADDPRLPLLTLLDLRLPKVDGIDVLRHARQHSAYKKWSLSFMSLFQGHFKWRFIGEYPEHFNLFHHVSK